MMIAGTASQQTAYPVEVSGWDEHEDFFVEKTELQWSEQSGKHILLCDRWFPAHWFPAD